MFQFILIVTKYLLINNYNYEYNINIVLSHVYTIGREIDDSRVTVAIGGMTYNYRSLYRDIYYYHNVYYKNMNGIIISRCILPLRYCYYKLI